MKGNVTMKKANFFLERKANVHIGFHTNKFYNGIITEVKEDYLIINDRVLGETPAYFSEIKDIEVFRQK